MLVLGIILIVVAAGVLLAAIAWGANDPAPYHAGALNLDLNVMTVFLLGAATLLVFVVGLEVLRSGLRVARKRRRDRKELSRLKEREAGTTGPGTTGSSGASPAPGTASGGPGSAGRSPADPS